MIAVTFDLQLKGKLKQNILKDKPSSNPVKSCMVSAGTVF